VGIVKDAGDDPDVTHGALIVATVRPGGAGTGIIYRAGEGVGTVTRPGLPIPVGEAAINPVPRIMIAKAIAEIAGEGADFEVEISVPGGAEIATKTLNPRLGILGGISILGTTGIVIPFSCSSWIHSIHRGIDVARAMGLDHVAGSTGSASENAVQKHHGLHEVALIDMGDFAGGTLKYLRRRPIRRVTLAGGFAKLAKLAQGHLDLHSSRSTVDLADLAAELGALDPATGSAAEGAVSAGEVLALAGAHRPALARRIAERARLAAGEAAGPAVAIEALVVDRGGAILAHVPGW